MTQQRGVIAMITTIGVGGLTLAMLGLDSRLVLLMMTLAPLVVAGQVEARLRYVLGLIRGMPFEGTAYLWPDPEGITSELVMLATGLATALAERCLARGDLDGVVWATGQGLRVLPGHEGLIALRLRARASTGDLAGVRQEWASYERVLADDWGGGEPAPELVALRRELLTR